MTELAARDVVAFLAVVSSLGLGVATLATGPRSCSRMSFGLGMLGFGVEAIAGYLLLGTLGSEERVAWAAIHEAAGLFGLVPWVVFVAALASPERPRSVLRWQLPVGLGCAALSAMGVAVLAGTAFETADVQGTFYAVQLDGLGRYGIMLQMLGTVVVLAGLEASLRASAGGARWRIKYLILGLGGIFLVRFYLFSQMLMFQVLMGVYVTTASVTLAVGNLAVAAALARSRVHESNFTVSRRLVYRSVVVGVLGAYLLVVGLLGWLLNRLGVAEEMFWGSIVVFVSALGLAAVLLSEDVRWRIKRFIGLNFYRSKYDYRQQWSAFTKRLASLVTLEEITPQLLGAAVEGTGAARAALYLADERDGHYHLAGALGGTPPAALASDSGLVFRLRQERQPVALPAVPESAASEDGGADAGADSHRAHRFMVDAVAVPFHWRGTLVGLMLLGPERAGARYTAEDFEFIATIAEQAAGAIVTARLSESLVQSREFEAFHRLTSFVIHDLKNSVGTLSMLSANALHHMQDPEFQKDAITTLSRSVERMRALLARLSAAPDAALSFSPVDLAALAREATAAAAIPRRIAVTRDLAELPPVSGDRDALLRVLHNLVTNAVEAVEGEGAISVRTYREGGSAVFSIADSGCGMSAEYMRKRLFTPFQSTKKGGWGIGLYHSKGIVEAHGGRIDVESRQGESTTFRVALPIDPHFREALQR